MTLPHDKMRVRSLDTFIDLSLGSAVGAEGTSLNKPRRVSASVVGEGANVGEGFCSPLSPRSAPPAT